MTQPAHEGEGLDLSFLLPCGPWGSDVGYQTRWVASPFLYPLGHFVGFISNPAPPFVLSAGDGTQGLMHTFFLAMSSKLILCGQSLGSAMAPSAWPAVVHLCLRTFSTSFL